MKKILILFFLLSCGTLIFSQSPFGGDENVTNEAANQIENLESIINGLLKFEETNPEAYDYSNVAESAKQFRRFESIFFGALPITILLSNTIYSFSTSDIKFNNESELLKTTYTPTTMLSEAQAKGIVLGSGIGAALLISAIDLILYNNKLEKEDEFTRVRTISKEPGDVPPIIDSSSQPEIADESTNSETDPADSKDVSSTSDNNTSKEVENNSETTDSSETDKNNTEETVN